MNIRKFFEDMKPILWFLNPKRAGKLAAHQILESRKRKGQYIRFDFNFKVINKRKLDEEFAEFMKKLSDKGIIKLLIK